MRDVLLVIGAITCVMSFIVVIFSLFDFISSCMSAYKNNKQKTVEELQEKIKQLEARIKGE